jgi:DNA-binding response OmpR family regulator
MEEEQHILIVDDEMDICDMLVMMLEYHGYKAVAAPDQEAALYILSSTPVALIIMDVLLSGSKGTDLCQQLKKDTKTSVIPVLMFSALSQAKHDCMAAGADDFIAKPFELKEIMAKVDYFMGRRTG